MLLNAISIVFLLTFYLGFIPRCDAFRVSISHTEYLTSIEFYKDGNKLPDFLLNYDFSDFLESGNIIDRRGRRLRADTHDAFFDTILIKKKVDVVGFDEGDNHTGMIEVYDEVTRKVWTGEFATHGVGEAAVATLKLDDDFITAAPLDRVQIIDTMQ
jgi:hypothetical protein